MEHGGQGQVTRMMEMEVQVTDALSFGWYYAHSIVARSSPLSRSRKAPALARHTRPLSATTESAK
jgi:hypothetical protein